MRKFLLFVFSLLLALPLSAHAITIDPNQTGGAGAVRVDVSDKGSVSKAKKDGAKVDRREYKTDVELDNKVTESVRNKGKKTGEQKKAGQQQTENEDDEETKKEKLKKAKEAEKNYQDAKENRDSTENRMLNFATTLAASQGASTMLSAMAEKKADAAAEQEMTAYLGGMYCEYGGGQSVRVGLANVEIPGGNELLNYYSEYKNIADRLKTQKTALNLPAGLESQTVYDKAESNLYKNASLGRGAGTQTSLSRALLDSNSADAAAWQAQKDKTAKNLKTGALVAGGAVVAGFAANKLLNREYNERKKKLKEDFKEKEKKFIEQNEEIVVTQPAEVEQEEVEEENAPKEETAEKTADKKLNSQIAIKETGDERSLSNVLSKIGFKADGKNKVLFANNKAELTDTGKETLKDFATNWVAQILDEYKDANLKIAITGHTDKTGTAEHNIDLSKRRAENVRRFLETNLANYKGRITYATEGKGFDDCSAAQGVQNPDCRRIDIKITDETPEETE